MDDQLKRFNDQKVKEALGACMLAMTGIHFTPEQAQELKRYIDAHTWPPT